MGVVSLLPRCKRQPVLASPASCFGKNSGGPRMFGESEFDPSAGLELICASAQAAEVASAPEDGLTPAALHPATVTQDAEQTGGLC